MSNKQWPRNRSASLRLLTWMMLILGVVLVGCADNATSESAGVGQDDHRQADGSLETGNSGVLDRDREPLNVDDNRSPFAEPDSGHSTGSEEISEDAASAPSEVILDADPDDDANIAQAGLGVAESALCATIQIGFDAATDGAHDLVKAQRATLMKRADSLSDRQLEGLVSELADQPLTEVAVLADALDRCVTLGFER